MEWQGRELHPRSFGYGPNEIAASLPCCDGIALGSRDDIEGVDRGDEGFEGRLEGIELGLGRGGGGLGGDPCGEIGDSGIEIGHCLRESINGGHKSGFERVEEVFERL